MTAERRKDQDVTGSRPQEVGSPRPVAVGERAAADPGRLIPEVPTGAGHGAAEIGQLQFLTLESREPVVQAGWRLHPATGSPGSSVEIESDHEGKAFAPLGEWTIESLERRWIPAQPSFSVRSEALATLWVDERTDLSFCVVDCAARPIPGVEVLWYPRIGIVAEWTAQREPPSRGLTDSAGRASFADGPCSMGTAVFLHPANRREIRSLGAAAREALTVVMQPSSEGRSLEVRSLVDHSPIMGAMLIAPEGYPIASSRSDSHLIPLPGWLPPEEVFEITSDSTYPCWARLSGVRDGPLLLPPEHTLTLVVLDDEPGSGPESRWARMETTGTWGDLVATPVIPDLITLDDEVTRIPLPRGISVSVSVSVSGSRGGFARADVSAEEQDPFLRLTLDHAATTRIRVRDPGRRPISACLATLADGRTFRGGRDGVILLPSALRAETLWISAPGFATRVMTPSPRGLDPAECTLAEVVLPIACRVTVHLHSPDGEPLSGLSCQLTPAPAAGETGFQGTADGPWGAEQALEASTVVSDGLGTCRYADLRSGRTRVRVKLDALFGTDGYARTLYNPPPHYVYIEDGGEYRLTLPAPRKLAIRALVGNARKPAEEFTLIDPIRGISLDVSGDCGFGWVSAALDRLTLSVPGVGTVCVDPRSFEVDEIAEILVAVSPVLELQIADLPAQAYGAQLDVRVLVDKDGDLMHSRSIPIRVDSSGRATLALEAEGGLLLGIEDLVLRGQRFGFTPQFQRLEAGRTMAFTCLPRAPTKD